MIDATPDEMREMGAAEGADAARRIVREFALTGKFGPEGIERWQAETERRASQLLASGVSAEAAGAYRQGNRVGFEREFDRLTDQIVALLLPHLPDDAEDEDDDDGIG